MHAGAGVGDLPQLAHAGQLVDRAAACSAALGGVGSVRGGTTQRAQLLLGQGEQLIGAEGAASGDDSWRGQLLGELGAHFVEQRRMDAVHHCARLLDADEQRGRGLTSPRRDEQGQQRRDGVPAFAQMTRPDEPGQRLGEQCRRLG